ncbi:MAG TPA: DsbA family protein [Stellaceae bacterium]|nr:DsbA family protein [Stellaceae bacterium]
MREIWFVALLGLLLAAPPPALAQGAKPAAATAAEADKLLAPMKDDRILGKPDAPITIIEYASLSCPHCAHFEDEVLPALKKKWIDTGKAKLVFRDFPLDAPALRAAMVARCAPPDRFFPLINTFFKSQEKWVLAKDQDAELEKWARVQGVTDKEFDACMHNKKIEDQVAQSRLTAAQQLGVDATPTFFVNGKKFEGAPTVEAFDQLLSGLSGKS